METSMETKWNEQKEKLQIVLDIFKNSIHDITDDDCPKIILNTDRIDVDEDYYCILVGDDSEICYENEKYFLLDYHDKSKEKEYMNAQEIADFCLGKDFCYGNVPIFKKISKEESFKTDSYHFCKGWLLVMKSMIEHLEIDLKEYESKKLTKK